MKHRLVEPSLFREHSKTRRYEPWECPWCGGPESGPENHEDHDICFEGWHEGFGPFIDYEYVVW